MTRNRVDQSDETGVSQWDEILQQRLRIYQELEKTIRASDPLLSSSSVYDAVIKRFEDGVISSADSPEEACAYVEANAKKLLNEDVSALKKTSSVIQDKMKNGNDWIKDEPFLRSLWASGCRDAVWKGSKDDNQLQKSTFCRMEGRYGQGAQVRDQVYTVLMLAGGGAATALGKLAVVAATTARTEIAVAAARVTFGVDIGATVFLGVHQTMKACEEKLGTLSEEASCRATTTDAEFKNVMSKRISQNSCYLTAGVSIASGGLAALGARTVIKGLHNSLEKEVLVSETASQKILDAVRRGPDRPMNAPPAQLQSIASSGENAIAIGIQPTKGITKALARSHMSLEVRTPEGARLRMDPSASGLTKTSEANSVAPIRIEVGGSTELRQNLVNTMKQMNGRKAFSCVDGVCRALEANGFSIPGYTGRAQAFSSHKEIYEALKSGNLMYNGVPIPKESLRLVTSSEQELTRFLTTKSDKVRFVVVPIAYVGGWTFVIYEAKALSE